MKDDNVIPVDFGLGEHPELAKLAGRLHDAIYEFSDRVPMVAVIGILVLLQKQVLEHHEE